MSNLSTYSEVNQWCTLSSTGSLIAVLGNLSVYSDANPVLLTLQAHWSQRWWCLQVWIHLGAVKAVYWHHMWIVLDSTQGFPIVPHVILGLPDWPTLSTWGLLQTHTIYAGCLVLTHAALAASAWLIHTRSVVCLVLTHTLLPGSAWLTHTIHMGSLTDPHRVRLVLNHSLLTGSIWLTHTIRLGSLTDPHYSYRVCLVLTHTLLTGSA